MKCSFCGREIELEERVIELRNGKFIQPKGEVEFHEDLIAYYVCSTCIGKATWLCHKVLMMLIKEGEKQNEN